MADDLLKKGATINPDATAISFFLTGDSYDQPMQVSYRDLMTNITQTANLFMFDRPTPALSLKVQPI